MRWIVETVYAIIKNYMSKKAEATGNAEFVAKLNAGFKAVEDAWAIITKKAETPK